MNLIELSADGLLTSLYQDVFAPAFPVDELMSLEAIRAGLLDGTTRAAAMTDEDGGVIAGAVAEWSESSRVLLLSYMAVAYSARSKGAGGQLYQHVLTEWTRDFWPCLFVAEVEHPDHHVGTSAQGDPFRRLRFYGSHGALVLKLPYFQPALHPNANRVYGMLMLALHVDSQFAGLGPATVHSSPLRTWFTEYLLETEGEVPKDAATTALMSVLASPKDVSLLPIERYREAPVALPSKGLGPGNEPTLK
jgi:hypothetical protein